MRMYLILTAVLFTGCAQQPSAESYSKMERALAAGELALALRTAERIVADHPGTAEAAKAAETIPQIEEAMAAKWKAEKAQPSPPTPDPDARRRHKETVDLMVASGTLMKWDSDRVPPRMYAGPNFYRLTFDQKVAAAKAINDYIADLGGKPGGALEFDIHDGYSGQRIYRWKYYKLVEP